MRRSWSVGIVVASATALALPLAPSASAADPVTGVFYEMNESAGTTVMVDSGGSGINGVVNPAYVTSGYTVSGATGYHWERRPPAVPPAEPGRIVQVADNPVLDPGASGTFTVEIRFRTKEKFGNIIQKGQAATKGGQWKIQNPKGVPSCLFKGSIGRVSTGVKTPINDNQWHVLTCVKTPTAVFAYVDGVLKGKKNGSTGTIDNKIPVTMGGKINCDQITVTCDYFSGEIDWVHIWHS
jgi:hypothetical protein